MKIKLTDFALKHFDPKSGGTKILDMTPEEFECKVNIEVTTTYDHRNNPQDIESFAESNAKVVDGYAPFCKLVFVKNFTNAKLGSMTIKLENYQYLRSGYHARTDKELPVLTRWFELPLPAPTANFLCLVLYSKEQIEKEAKGQDNATEMFGFDADWGIVAILAQGTDHEEPMAPITMMRNALGIEEGGSGFPLIREKYEESVKFWSQRAIIKS